MGGASKKPTSRGDLAPTSKRASRSQLPWLAAPPYTISVSTRRLPDGAQWVAQFDAETGTNRIVTILDPVTGRLRPVYQEIAA